jgi:hypothetical protein
MNIVDSIASFFTSDQTSNSDSTPEGVCPNCWGRQEYGGHVRDLYASKQIDVNNNKAHHAFIQDFVVSKIDGIRIVKSDTGLTCMNCKTSFS